MIGLIIIGGLVLYLFISYKIYKFVKKDSNNKWIHRLVLGILILIPTYDIALTYIFAGYYCFTTPNTHIKKVVETPKSIYFEDKIYNGFNKDDRKLIIKNYLDGVHLQTLALQGDDGRIYVYSARESDFRSFKFDKTKYKDRYVQYAELIYSTTEQIYNSKAQMPKMNYSVIYEKDPLPSIINRFIRRDEVKIIDNNTNEMIAYNGRITRGLFNITPSFSSVKSATICGDTNVLYFDHKILTKYTNRIDKHGVWINNKYNSEKTKEKRGQVMNYHF